MTMAIEIQIHGNSCVKLQISIYLLKTTNNKGKIIQVEKKKNEKKKYRIPSAYSRFLKLIFFLTA